GSQCAAQFLASVKGFSLLPALDDVLVRALIMPRLLAQRRESPWRLWMIALDLAFAAAVRMVHGVHGHAANGRLFPVPACAAGFHSHWLKNVALLTIRVMQERQVRAAVRVVLNGRHFRGYADLLAPEVHLAVRLLMAAAAVPDHDFALVVAAAGTLLRLQQRL